MRTFLTASLFSLISAAPMAQVGPLTPAPVPGISTGHVTPADRAGESNAAANQAPFSGTPNNMIPGGGQPTPQTIGLPDSRQSAPSPAVTK